MSTLKEYRVKVTMQVVNSDGKPVDWNGRAQIDPYIVHRRPTVPVGTVRTFLRISFVPVEIEDDTCAQNPLLPVRAPYNRADIRSQLVRY